MKILIIEDEFSLADTLRDRLNIEDYEVEIALDGDEGEYIAMSDIFDLIIMDWMLPGQDGISIIKRLRENEINCPIIMLTAKADLENKVYGLNHGADDYLTKPFDMEELVARVNALLRRATGYGDKTLKYGDITLNLNLATITCNQNQNSVSVTTKELSLIEYLIINKQQTVTKGRISERIWGYNEEYDYNHVEVYISFLRKKLKFIGAKTEIKTIRGVGYSLEA